MKLTRLRDTNGFPRQHITQQLKTQYIQRHTLRGDHVLSTATLTFTLPDHQRPNTVRVTEGHQTKAGNQRHCGITTFAAFMDHLDGIKNVAGGGLELAQAMQLMGKYIEQHF